MAHGLVQPGAERDLFRMRGGEFAQSLFVAAVPGAEDDEGAVLCDEKLAIREQKIDPLLLGQPTDHAENRPAELWIETVAAQQFRPADRLAGQVVHGIRRRQQRIGCGIPYPEIDAVEQADKILGPSLHHAFEAAGKFRSLDFLGVMRADCGHAVGEKDAALHHAHLPVKLDAIYARQLLRQIRPVERSRGKKALEGDIMNGEDGLERESDAVAALGKVQQQRQ